MEVGVKPPRSPLVLGPALLGSSFPALAGSAFVVFLLLYLDAVAWSWALTFLRPQRPRDPRQGAPRASFRRGREDASESVGASVLGRRVGNPSRGKTQILQ